VIHSEHLAPRVIIATQDFIDQAEGEPTGIDELVGTKLLCPRLFPRISVNGNNPRSTNDFRGIDHAEANTAASEHRDSGVA
jgi:hypothetical protein